MHENGLDDARSNDPVERLLEDSWEQRGERASRRELTVEAIAAVSFLLIAVPMAIPALLLHPVDPLLVALLIGLYALVAGAIRFPVGAGYMVPSYLVLVPMLLLLPPAAVPLVVAVALVLASVARCLAGRVSAEHILFSVPNAWHALGPALVLILAGRTHGELGTVAVYLAAFLASGVVDFVTSTLRETFALSVAPQLQLRVAAVVYPVDACIAPLGLLLAHVARDNHLALLMALPFSALLWILERERSARIAQAQLRLELIARERTRLQAAVRRLGDAFAAKLDLTALTSIVLYGSLEAMDADAGQLTLEIGARSALVETTGEPDQARMLAEVGAEAQESGGPRRLERDGVWALALPLSFASDGESGRGALTVSRRAREFRHDEQALLHGLVERAETAICDILGHEALHEQAVTDPLTSLGNRRKLASKLSEQLTGTAASEPEPFLLMLFDLDGFKGYNDTFGHLAGDALLAHLGGRLAAAVAPHGTAYRLGGDEFCVLLPADPGELHEHVARAASALSERGETFSISASCGTVLLPHEASTTDYALQLADQRMYARKSGRPSAVREQTRDVLLRIMHAKQPDLPEHSSGVAHLAIQVGRRLGMTAEQIDELARAAELHDIGKVGLPDAILDKPGALDSDEWEFVRRHTILGERILSAAPALRPVATIVRASHERWDGRGYPDRLAGEEIPLAARIVAVCDAYEAITSDRCYRQARSGEAARRELTREAGRQFDPHVVAAFLLELEQPGPVIGVRPAAEEAWELAEQVLDLFMPVLESRLATELQPEHELIGSPAAGQLPGM
jgi:diguanylate cyclase (GGDEF)-like protein